MALFKKLFKKDEAANPAPKADEKKTETKPDTAAYPARNLPTEEKPAAKKAPAKTTAKAPAKAPAKPASKAPAAKPAAKKNTTEKSAEKAAPNAVRMTSEPAVKATRQTGRPFFVTTEEELKAAFDEAIAAAEEEIAKSDSKAVGKYEFSLEVDGFHFYLSANNGQVLFDSPSFTTLIGALNGIQTFKKTVAEGAFAVKVDKYNRYRFILARKYYGENYDSKDQCQKCVESVKKFASCSKILPFTPTREEINAFEAAKTNKRLPDDIDWKAVAEAEEAAQKMGKFEICAEEPDQYCFYLTANNGQILYSSRYYANEAACRRGIDSFKKAAYVGNFFVDRDKFGNYRYVLKNIGSAPAFIGESYDNRPQCEKIIDSVKKFIVTATIEKAEA